VAVIIVYEIHSNSSDIFYLGLKKSLSAMSASSIALTLSGRVHYRNYDCVSE